MSALRRVAFLSLLVVVATAPSGRADDRLGQLAKMIGSGKAAEARPLIVQARKDLASQSNTSSVAMSDFLLAAADFALSDVPRARTELDRASAEFAQAGDPIGQWLSALTLAEIEKRSENVDATIAAYERALAALRDAAASPTLSLDSLKTLGSMCGMSVDLVGLVFSNPDLLKAVLPRIMEMMTRDQYAAALIDLGALDKADEQLTAATMQSAMFFGMYDAPIATHMGDLRRRQWRFDEARQSYVKALNALKLMPLAPVDDHSHELDILEKLADTELLSGRVDEALAWNDRSLKVARATSSSKREASVLDERGNLLLRGGREHEAETTFQQALQVADASGVQWLRGAILVDLGTVHMFVGRYGTSAADFEKAIEIYEALNEPYLESVTWILFGEVAIIVDDKQNADLAIEKARALAKKSGFKLAGSFVETLVSARRVMSGQASPAEFNHEFDTWWRLPGAEDLMVGRDAQRVLTSVIAAGSGARTDDLGPLSPATEHMLGGMAQFVRGKIAFDRRDFEAARAAWKEGIARDANSDHRAGFLGLIGSSYWVEGKRDDAIRSFEEAARTVESTASNVKVEETLTSFLGSNRRFYYEILIDMLLKQGRVREAFEESERARARAFLQMIGNHRLSANGHGNPALVQQAEILRTQIANWEMQASEGRPPEIGSDLRFARDRYKALLVRIKESNPEYASLTAIEPLNTKELQSEIAPDATIVSYFVTATGVHAWALDRTALTYERLPLDAAGLQRIVCWAARYRPGDVDDARGTIRLGSRCSAVATAEEAYDALIAPVRAHIHTNRIVIVPHGVLHYVPFAALRDSRSGKYLLEDYTIAYAPSASALRFLHAKETPVTGGALVLGNPKTAAALAPLAGAEREATMVARRLGTTVHLDADARESLLYHLDGKVDLVHIAAHAIYDPVSPLFSRIALAPGDGEDGNLEVHEILSRVDLTGVNLVVLSACETAIGERSGGDDIVGLTRALLYAGAPGVISTLWNIDDVASEKLMTDFYRRLGDGALAVDALRDAQLTVLRDPEFRDPRFWAAFTLTGDPQGRWKSSR